MLIDLEMTRPELAKILSISKSQLSEKINGHYPWKQPEINKILEISRKPYEEIFLNHTSSKSKKGD